MMKWRSTYALSTLILLSASLLFAQDEPRIWTARTANTSLQFNHNLLKDLGITLNIKETGKPLSDKHVAFSSAPASQLVFVAPRGDFETLDSGSLFHNGGFSLTLPDGGVIDLTGFELRAKRYPENFELYDRSGNRWFLLSYAHTQLLPTERLLTYRHMDVNLSPELAERLNLPLMVNTHLARADLELTVDIPEGITFGNLGACDPDTTGTDKDVSLTGLGFISYHSRSGDRVAFAPGATLRNEGEESVIWNYAIAPDTPNGQHPFLVMHFYRLSEDGVLEMIGQSDVKHAFFTINSGCGCSGGHVLYTGCSDTYSAGNNTSTYFLGPRDEVDPFTGRWDSVGSHFDNDQDDIDECEGEGVDCDNLRSHNGEGDATHILSALEADLETPGARYFMEAWYIVQHDRDIWNGVGFREVNPTRQDEAWAFPYVGSMINGSVLDAWVDPSDTPDNAGRHRIRTSEGSLQLSQVVTDLGDGFSRYTYSLMNMDFTPGVASISLPFSPGAARGGVFVSIPKHNPATPDTPRTTEDWSAVWDGGQLNLTAPENGQLRWGTMMTIIFEAEGEPVVDALTLDPSRSGDGSGVSLNVMVPGSDCLTEVLPLVPDWPGESVIDIIIGSGCLQDTP